MSKYLILRALWSGILKKYSVIDGYNNSLLICFSLYLELFHATIYTCFCNLIYYLELLLFIG